MRSDHWVSRNKIPEFLSAMFQKVTTFESRTNGLLQSRTSSSNRDIVMSSIKRRVGNVTRQKWSSVSRVSPFPRSLRTDCLWGSSHEECHERG